MKPSRVRLALALLFALGVVAAVAAFASSSSTSLARHGAQLVDKRTGDPDAIGASSAESTIGQPEEARSGDMTGAAEDYANRAYPSDVVPFELTQAAVNSWTAAVASSQGKGKNNVGTWQLVGPDQATYPGVLNRSGALYHASGRITALSLKPGCSANDCELLLAAAGGGVWFTDKALSQTAKRRTTPRRPDQVAGWAPGGCCAQRSARSVLTWSAPSRSAKATKFRSRPAGSPRRCAPRRAPWPRPTGRARPWRCAP